MAPHSSTLAWKIPWTEEPGRSSPWGRWESDTTEWLHFHFSLSCIGEGNGNPLQCSCLENPREGGACWATCLWGRRVGHEWSNLAASSLNIYIHLVHLWSEVKWSASCSVMSNSLCPHVLHSPWNSLGQNTGVSSIPFSRESSQLRDWTQVSHTAGEFLPVELSGTSLKVICLEILCLISQCLLQFFSICLPIYFAHILSAL